MHARNLYTCNAMFRTTMTKHVECHMCIYRVLNHSGSQVHDWLSKLLMGPDVRTTQKLRSSFEYPSGLGITVEHLDAVVKVLKAWNLLDCPMILAEDATAQQCRADVMGVSNETLIFGFNGPILVVKTGAEFEKLVGDKKASYATLLYVYTLVPLVRGAPYLPLFAFSHDGSKRTFTPALIKNHMAMDHTGKLLLLPITNRSSVCDACFDCYILHCFSLLIPWTECLAWGCCCKECDVNVCQDNAPNKLECSPF